ncbi:MAG: hypothetical protein AAGA99_12105 [Actinomycetota bacterium]
MIITRTTTTTARSAIAVVAVGIASFAGLTGSASAINLCEADPTFAAANGCEVVSGVAAHEASLPAAAVVARSDLEGPAPVVPPTIDLCGTDAAFAAANGCGVAVDDVAVRSMPAMLVGRVR